jgi:poly(3-hydroxybutyrate) depolymerase
MGRRAYTELAAAGFIKAEGIAMNARAMRFFVPCLILVVGWGNAATSADTASALVSAKSPYDDPYGNTHVVCLDDPTQSYELYIPHSAPTTGPSPILYGFDPSANGKSMLIYLADAAAANGWIVAASNNSQNGPWSDIFTAQDAIMRDTEARLNLHPTRRFAAGMSGGARVSLALAFRYPDKICGTLLFGAGWPVNTTLEPSTNRLNVYILIGTQDSNYSYDIPETQGQLTLNGIRCVVQTFNGGHVLPPANLTLAGAQWLNANAERDPNSGLAPASCAEGSLFGELPPTPYDAWQGHISDSLDQESVFENFSGLEAPITHVEWWGLPATYNTTAAYWIPCDTAGDVFTISFHPDAGGVPGAAVHQETVTAVRTDLPALYSRNYALRHYSVVLSSRVSLASGWVRIQQVADSDCVVLWLNSHAGDNHALEYSETYDEYIPVPDDLAVCLAGERPTITGAAGWREEGTPLQLRVTFPGGVGTVTYAWFKDGAALSGQTGAVLNIAALALSDTGSYWCQVTDQGKAIYETPHVSVFVFPAGSLPLTSVIQLLAVGAVLCLAGILFLRRRRGFVGRP